MLLYSMIERFLKNLCFLQEVFYKPSKLLLPSLLFTQSITEDTCWRSSAASSKTSLEFVTQGVSHPTQGNSILSLIFTDEKELSTVIYVGSWLGTGDHDLITFSRDKRRQS